MAVAVKSLGLPWIHTGVSCGNCNVTPISGYRFRCDSCPNHDLCEKCFRLGHTQRGHNFLRIARDSNNFHPPFQVYYIVCDECGTAPIEGRRYHHKWRPNRNLCVDCYTKQPQAAREYEIIEEVKIPTICTTHSPVFHFHKRCGSCGVKPITGPRFDSIAYPDYSLCLVCFDTKFIKGTIKNEEFVRVERPEINKVRQIFVYSCMSCGEVPICGPAYVNQRVPEKVFCLLCYMNVPRQVQFEYSRVECPTQLGDPPAPEISQHGALVPAGSVRSDEYAKLAREFELYRKEKEEKEEQAKVMAKNFMQLSDKYTKQQTMGRSGDGELERLRREKAEAVLECAKLSDDIERLKKEKEDDAEYATRIYVSRIEALEKELIQSQEALRTGEASYASIQEQFEKVMLEKDEALEFASLARELETTEVDKQMHADMALEFDKLKEAHLELTRQFELLKLKSDEDSRLSAEKFDNVVKEHSTLATQSENEKQELLIFINGLEDTKSVLEEAARNSAEKQEQLVRDQLRLTEDYNVLMEEKETLEKQRDELAVFNANLEEEVEKLKTEKSEAVENAILARGLVATEAEKEETLRAEVSNLSSELEKLKQMHVTLTSEYENLMKEKEDAAIAFAEKYESLAKELLTLNEEFDEWKEEKALAEREWEEKHSELTKETMTLKEKGETGSVFAAKYEELERAHTRYVELHDYEVKELVDNVKRLEEEREAMEGNASLAAEREADILMENKNLKEEAAKWTELIGDFHALVKDKEAKLLEVDQLLKDKEAKLVELEQLLEEKEAASEARARDYSTLNDDYEALEKENGDLIEKYETLKEEYETLKEEYELFRTEKEQELKEKELVMSRGLDDHSSLAQQLNLLKKDLVTAEETTKLSRAEFLELSEEFEKLQEDAAQREHDLMHDFEMMKNEKEEEIADLMDRIQSLEVLLKEKEAALKTGAAPQAALLKEIESLKEELRVMEEDKQMEAENASGFIHGLQKQVEKLESSLKEKESVGSIAAVSSIKKMEGQGVNMDQYNRILTENETLREEIESVKEDFDEIYPKFQKLFQSKVTKEEFERLKVEYDRLKANIPASILSVNTPGVGKCALLAICCYGAINERKKESLEEGYERSRRNCNDQDLLRQSEEFMNEAAKELDKQFDNYMEEALSITDKEAEEFFLTLQPMFDTGHSTPISKSFSTKVVRAGQAAARK
ncbi:hypothetical protein MPTK1_1g15030 [Marchantia polymorpha subsp. ruderalis]|uniref:ZZ-type domain-containing protein n=2 Tax=Marchantia polymorpha TaxID=3197 RepID=A0AAF6AQB8_MARPO|nr:hypothetical protein MARPO_0033s0158 [Marchantia polymorpha]BBM98638.1 hypothetical protein Mp_1g15030 [Marchantia polymorpha subsp. ruderalis]|eukprot:PTQ41771.1 hypothetical protein MARPO_0033s0158 [Marchantia polymorpha]